MRLYIVGLGCMLFFLGHIEAATKIKIAQHVTTSGYSQHCGCGVRDPSMQTSKNDDLYKLPYGGGILNAQDEYIPGTFRTLHSQFVEKFWVLFPFSHSNELNRISLGDLGSSA